MIPWFTQTLFGKRELKSILLMHNGDPICT